MIRKIRRHKVFLLGLVTGWLMTASWLTLKEGRKERRLADLEAQAKALIERGAAFEEYFVTFGPWKVLDHAGESWWFEYVEPGVYYLVIEIDRETQRVVGSARGPFQSYR